MEKHNQQIAEEKEIPIINPIEFPFRLSSTYPVSLEDLLRVLQNMIADLSNPNRKSRNQIQLEPVEDFEFDQYFAHVPTSRDLRFIRSLVTWVAQRSH